MRVAWTRLALADLAHAHDFIAADNPSAATRIIEDIEQAIAIISRHPQVGRPGRIKGTRELVAAGTPFIIPYRVRQEKVEILAVLHGARQWPEAWQERLSVKRSLL